MYPSRRGNSLRVQRSSAGREGERQSHRSGDRLTLLGTGLAVLLLLSYCFLTALLLLSLGDTTIPREPGRAGWGCSTLQGHCWKQCGQECCWVLASSRQVTCLDL